MKQNSQLMAIFLFLIICSSSVNTSEWNFLKNIKNKVTNSFKNAFHKMKGSNFPTKLYDKQTGWNKNESGAINALKHHTIDCSQENSAINSFKMEMRNHKRKTQLRFSYTCVESPAISNRCRVLQTAEKTAEFKVKESLDSLAKHYVECGENEVMTKVALKTKGKFFTGLGAIFRLLPQDHPKLFYQYTCCQAEFSRKEIILSRTKQSANPNNQYNHLIHQYVKGYDKVALKFFHLQTPGNEIYYEMKYECLKGETCPSYRDYFKYGGKQSFMGKLFLIFLIFLIFVIFLILEINARTLRKKSKRKTETTTYLPASILYRNK